MTTTQFPATETKALTFGQATVGFLTTTLLTSVVMVVLSAV